MIIIEEYQREPLHSVNKYNFIFHGQPSPSAIDPHKIKVCSHQCWTLMLFLLLQITNKWLLLGNQNKGRIMANHVVANVYEKQIANF